MMIPITTTTTMKTTTKNQNRSNSNIRNVKIVFLFAVIFAVAGMGQFSMKIDGRSLFDAAEFESGIAPTTTTSTAVAAAAAANANGYGKGSDSLTELWNNYTNSKIKTKVNVKQEDDADNLKIEKKQKRKEKRRKEKRMKKREEKGNDSIDKVTQKNDENEEEQQQQEQQEEIFSACILWMDDNYRLEEWIAYHYYIMKLRYIVINIDPNSIGSPMDIINRWNNNDYHHLNMTIVTMTDTDHFTEKEYQNEMNKIKKVTDNITATARDHGRIKTNHHRKRQNEFYRTCSKHLLEVNKDTTWVSYHDTDEFITFTHRTKKPNGTNRTIQEGLLKMKQPGYVLNRLNEIKEEDAKYLLNSSQDWSSFKVAELKKELKKRDITAKGKKADLVSLLEAGDFSCVVVNRVRYNSKELSTYDYNQLKEYNIPDTVDTKLFDTLRYKHITGYDGSPKSFIDLSHQRARKYTQDKFSKWMTHMPMQNHCRDELDTRNKETKGILKNESFVINHYLGSWEAYSFREDARKGGDRNYDRWLERSNMTTANGGTSIIAWPWMRGFIDLVGGTKIALYLLQDAGKFPRDYNATANIQDWNITYTMDKKWKDNKLNGNVSISF